ncbi:hypothetical protein PtB15_14B488 [Puccinia triticina]|nr:hypothetical protein PtB15_14B488 [Puccinia triticina]
MSSLSAVLSIIGFAIFYASGDQKVRYGSLFFSIPGAYGVSPCLTAWTADNSAPHERKATALALGTMIGNSGGLFSVWAGGDLVAGKKPNFHSPEQEMLFEEAWDQLGDQHPDFKYVY